MKTDNAIRRIIEIEDEASLDTAIHRLHPLSKLLVTVAFLVFTISYGKYNIGGVVLMWIYVLAVFTGGLISFSHCVKRIWPVLPMLVLFGLANIFLERGTATHIGRITISYGVLSFVTIIFKGLLTVTACYLLVATTGIENICYALRLIKIPSVIVTQLLLTYRYLTVLVEQAGEISEAYRLRAPGERGIRIKIAGSLLGQLLIRTLDRAQAVYEGMLLRGYDGSFPTPTVKSKLYSNILWVLIWFGIFAMLRFIDIPALIGSAITKI